MKKLHFFFLLVFCSAFLGQILYAYAAPASEMSAGDTPADAARAVAQTDGKNRQSVRGRTQAYAIPIEISNGNAPADNASVDSPSIGNAPAGTVSADAAPAKPLPAVPADASPAVPSPVATIPAGTADEQDVSKEKSRAPKQNENEPRMYMALRYMQSTMSLSDNWFRTSNEPSYDYGFQNKFGLNQKISFDEDVNLDGHSYSLVLGILSPKPKFKSLESLLRLEGELMLSNHGEMKQAYNGNFYLNNGKTVSATATSTVNVGLNGVALLNIWLDIPVWKFRPYVGGSLGAGILSYDYNIRVASSDAAYLDESYYDFNFSLYAGLGAGVYTILFDHLIIDIHYRGLMWDVFTNKLDDDEKTDQLQSNIFDKHEYRFKTSAAGFGASVGILF